MENKKSNKQIIILSVFVAVLAVMTITFAVLYAVNRKGYNESSINLENVYQRSFYDLVENINNTEAKLGKMLSSNDRQYSQKMLREIHEDTNKAQLNLSYLPISMNGIPDTIKFINQLDGYTQTLSKNGELTSENMKTLNRLHVSIIDVKGKLNDMSNNIAKGYSISINSKGREKDFTEFTKLMQSTKTKDADFPTMIYDGPFADTVLNKEIKGLNFTEVSKEKAAQNIKELLNADKVSYAGEANGKFSTFDFNITIDKTIKCYAQVTKKGGKLLTLSSYSDSNAINYDKNYAIGIAKNFTKKQGIKDVECVWSDVVGNDAYINLAPIENSIIYYPDLIKVKVDLSSGKVIGYEATPYYTNHVQRNLPKILISKTQAEKKINKGYEVETIKLALSPIEDYNQEILTYEIKSRKGGAVYYFYVDVQNGNVVNILKVIETNNGNLLM